ncbi:MAG: hypothetical protein HZB16_22695 [Armatimonadetes bacterium]|nr:hypothetical protein [Armatimonadota bacterium]
MSRRSWRLVALTVLGLGGLALGLYARPAPARAMRALVQADASDAQRLPLDCRRGAVQGVAGRWLGLGVSRGTTVADAEAWFERQLGGPKLESFAFDTTPVGQPTAAARPLDCLLISPPGAPPTVLIYLASSGVSRGPGLDIEALTLYRWFDPPRRLLVVPLPAAEQRGPGWPSLATADADVLAGMARQMTLDVSRAVQACQGQGLRVEALGGFSLGGCFAAAACGLRPDLLADVDLFVWGAGGDLGQLAALSTHGLAGQLRCPPGASAHAWRRKLARLDPLTYAGDSRVARAVLVGGRSDSIMPSPCVAALARGLERAGAHVRVDWVDGGHLATIGAPPALTRWFAW